MIQGSDGLIWQYILTDARLVMCSGMLPVVPAMTLFLVVGLARGRRGIVRSIPISKPSRYRAKAVPVKSRTGFLSTGDSSIMTSAETNRDTKV